MPPPEAAAPAAPTKLLSRLAARLGFTQAVFAEIDTTDRQFGTHAFNGGYSGNGLQGQGYAPARNRLIIYRKWQQMITDPVISSALRLHCTAALGGHETSGDCVFIEKNPAVTDKSADAIVKELHDDLGPILNRIAYSLCFNAASFGDAYSRLYTRPGEGVIDANVDQLFMPPLVQAYERGSRTEGFVVYVGKKQREKLTALQMARVRMPRTLYEPQPLAVEMAWHAAVREDDIEKSMLLPALAGGSMLQGCEEAYDRYLASLIALVGKRSKGSIDAAWLKVNVAGMSAEAQKALLDSVENAQNYLKRLQNQAIASKNPILESIRFLLPVSNETQVTTLEDASGADNGQGYTIEDVMFHAKLLAGALGIDLSMLGFADLLSGGLGDGGAFRQSAQAAEKSRMLRNSLAEAFNHIIDVHLFIKHKMQYPAGQRPWQINFYSTISALESEKSRTRQDNMATTQVLVGLLESLKNLGMKKDAVEHILSKIAQVNEDSAKLIAKALDAAEPPNPAGLDGFAPAAGTPANAIDGSPEPEDG